MRTRLSQVRGNYVSRGGRLWVSHINEQTFAELVRDELAERPSADIAFFDMEALKAQLLLDQLQRPFTPLRTSERGRRAESIERSLLDFGECRPADQSLLVRELMQVSRIPLGGLIQERSHAEAVAELEQLHQADKAGFDGAATVPKLSDLRAALGVDEALIAYFIPHNPLHPARDLTILIATRQKVALQTISLDAILGTAPGTGRMSIDGCPPMDTSELGEQVAMLRVDIQSSNEKHARRRLRSFHRLLIEPVIRAGFVPTSFKRWIIVPHGPLHLLPFAALIDADDHFLIEHTAIAMSPSGAVWYEKQKNALSNPESVVGVLALPSPDSEMQALRAAFPGQRSRFIQRDRASKKTLRDLAPRARVLHIAAHGQFPDQSARLSQDHAVARRRQRRRAQRT